MVRPPCPARPLLLLQWLLQLLLLLLCPNPLFVFILLSRRFHFFLFEPQSFLFHFLIVLLLLLLLFLLSRSLAGIGVETEETYGVDSFRLPPNVVPHNYDITFTTDLENFVFNGIVKIQIAVNVSSLLPPPPVSIPAVS